MGGGNSSSVQMDINQQISNNIEQWGAVDEQQLCLVSGVEIISKGCTIKVTNKCLQTIEIKSDNIFSLAASATAEASSEQSAAMISFLSSNDSNVSQSIQQTFETNVSNSCEIMGSSTAIVENLRINAENCGKSGIEITNFGQQKARCDMAQTSNLITDADLASDTQQSTSLFGGGSFGSSSGAEGAQIIGIIFFIIFVALAFILLFKFLKRRKSKKKKAKEEED